MGLFDKLRGKKTEKGEGIAMQHGAQGTATVKDVVCGMDVDPKTAPAKSEFMGKTYYFCSPGCKKTFDANPAKYAGGGSEMAGHSASHQM